MNTTFSRYMNDKVRLKPLVAPVIFNTMSRCVFTNNDSTHCTCVMIGDRIYMIDVTGRVQNSEMVNNVGEKVEVQNLVSCSLVNILSVGKMENVTTPGTAYNTCPGCIAYIVTSTQCIHTSIIGNNYEQLTPTLTVYCPQFMNVIGAPLINHYGQVIGIVAEHHESGQCRCYYIDTVIDILTKNRTVISDIGIQWRVIDPDRVLITKHTGDMFKRFTNGIDNRYILSFAKSRNSIQSILSSIYTMPVDYNFKCILTDLLTGDPTRIHIVLKNHVRIRQSVVNLREYVMDQSSVINDKLTNITTSGRETRKSVERLTAENAELIARIDKLEQPQLNRRGVAVDINLD